MVIPLKLQLNLILSISSYNLSYSGTHQSIAMATGTFFESISKTFLIKQELLKEKVICLQLCTCDNIVDR